MTASQRPHQPGDESAADDSGNDLDPALRREVTACVLDRPPRPTIVGVLALKVRSGRRPICQRIHSRHPMSAMAMIPPAI